MHRNIRKLLVFFLSDIFRQDYVIFRIIVHIICTKIWISWSAFRFKQKHNSTIYIQASRLQTTQDFDFDFLQPLIDKLAIKNKNIVLIGDFNVDLLHYESNNPTRKFLDLYFSASLTPWISIPTPLTAHSKTLIDSKATLHSFLSFRLKEY